MRLKFPTYFNVKYPDENKKYYNYNTQKQIKGPLTEASSGYCMYCGNLVVINGKNMGQLEHSIEKKQNEIEVEYLKHCKFNMSIACSICNTSLKKSGIKPVDINTDYKCSDKCSNVCNEYSLNKEEYIKKNSIIIMPEGISYNNKSFDIEYDLLGMSFEFKRNENYTEDELNFIQEHIDRFRLNSEEYMPIDLLNICIHVINYNDIPEKGMYNNVIGDIFIEYLNNIKDTYDSNIIKLCELVLLYNII